MNDGHCPRSTNREISTRIDDITVACSPAYLFTRDGPQESE
jgi:hypothetical protein